jgi:hypothetical protein
LVPEKFQQPRDRTVYALRLNESFADFRVHINTP